ncbi:hypothetical protein [Helicobacter cetorum]|uniref:Uncharacterized protein n=1 Tax=Helicobacter cetorum (strain ATCC BAA-429 / MIT 00-7128) TaxID=182217 RepID=I0EME4_HELC0|nr:hypothetical protein [Helicobacter cetorum]AFI04113.1 hypothetical protein HCW_04220 [Helicobacter cetorum MIT 00-7128]
MSSIYNTFLREQLYIVVRRAFNKHHINPNFEFSDILGYKIKNYRLENTLKRKHSHTLELFYQMHSESVLEDLKEELNDIMPSYVFTKPIKSIRFFSKKPLLSRIISNVRFILAMIFSPLIFLYAVIVVLYQESKREHLKDLARTRHIKKSLRRQP